MNGKQLLAELTEALRKRADARKIWTDKRAEEREARGKYNDRIAIVEEIQDEIETGVTGRPLLDAINDRAAANGPGPPPVAAKTPKIKQPDPKLANLRYESTKETLDRLIHETASTTPAAPPPDRTEQSTQPAPAVAPGSSPGRPNASPNRLREPTIMGGGAAKSAPKMRQFVIAPTDGGWDSASLANAAEDLGCIARNLVICGTCAAARADRSKMCPRCKGEKWRYPWVDELTPSPRPAAAPASAGPKRKGAPRASHRP